MNMRFFNIAGIAETCSTICLYFIAMPLKYIGGNDILVSTIGPIHGGLWMLYIGLLYWGYFEERWDFKSVIIGGILSMVPAGPIWFERRLISAEGEDVATA
ncbi:MAG: DUF3817 domain-containing protein [Candidatus Thalassarchaeaceae archaeon]|jgi:integral membrane protein|nr:DUF3817 domain-containing protein [Candidatus Thalassarchaeaceae archaeon]